MKGAVNHFLLRYCLDLMLYKTIVLKFEKVNSRVQILTNISYNLRLYIEGYIILHVVTYK